MASITRRARCPSCGGTPVVEDEIFYVHGACEMGGKPVPQGVVYLPNLVVDATIGSVGRDDEGTLRLALNHESGATWFTVELANNEEARAFGALIGARTTVEIKVYQP